MKTFLKVCGSFVLLFYYKLFNVNILEDISQIKVLKKSQLLARNDQQDEQEQQNKHNDEPQNTAAMNTKNGQQDKEQDE